MRWNECVPELLEHLGKMGLVGLVKIDGEREHKPWTVVISGQRSMVRRSGSTATASTTA
ncbi:hypothetical protein [Micromonospora sp. NPDC047134]|uniref:hypothetical protein n=1 Tax=Micromonospora sp. NPDC047134 TaxID=3154340 RepID=UPI0033F3D889